MGISLDAEHLKRYRDLARLLVRHGRSDLLRQAGLEDIFREEDVVSPAEADAERLASDLEEMGPTFIKLGQLLSTRADILPGPYLTALSRLQDSVEPFPFSEVEETVGEELGVRLSKAFSEFDPEPIAAASLGQVHRAALRDGRPVAVKVQRPGIRRIVHQDLEVLEDLAELLQEHTDTGRAYALPELIEQFRRSIAQELDYRSEAEHLRRLSDDLAHFERILIPLPVADYTTSKVLTMELVRGRKITELSPLVRLELDGHELADDLFRAYLEQVLVNGFFHADPHPGNVFLTDDRRIALIDLGMVAYVAEEQQELLLRLLLALADGRGGEVADLAEDLAGGEAAGDRDAFRRRISRLVSEHQESRTSDLQLGRVLTEVSGLCAEHGIRLPPELSMLGKTLMNLDEIGRTLDPDYEPNAAIRRHAGDLMQRRMWKKLSPSNLASTAMELNDLLQRLPARVNRLLRMASENQLRLRVDAIDEMLLMGGLQKIANRITAGLVIAALIVGAAMLMQVETDFTIFGYPGFAMIMFLLAAGAGFVLLFNIARIDVSEKLDQPREKKS